MTARGGRRPIWINCPVNGCDFATHGSPRKAAIAYGQHFAAKHAEPALDTNPRA